MWKKFLALFAGPAEMTFDKVVEYHSKINRVLMRVSGVCEAFAIVLTLIGVTLKSLPLVLLANCLLLVTVFILLLAFANANETTKFLLGIFSENKKRSSGELLKKRNRLLEEFCMLLDSVIAEQSERSRRLYDLAVKTDQEAANAIVEASLIWLKAKRKERDTLVFQLFENWREAKELAGHKVEMSSAAVENELPSETESMGSTAEILQKIFVGQEGLAELFVFLAEKTKDGGKLN